MPKIYTKTGDKGQTSLIGGTRVDKSDLRVGCYGTVDELNAYIGLLHDQLESVATFPMLIAIQHELFVIGSLLASDTDKSVRMLLPKLKESSILVLESEIDKMNETLPPLKYFILPGGHVFVSYAHVARTVCRRAERECTALLATRNDEDLLLIIKYLNRLSDYLFVLARCIGQEMGVEEIKWIPEK